MMSSKKRLAGAQRRLTDAQVKQLCEWKPFKELCREMGISVGHGSAIRRGYYYHKRRSP